MLFVNVRAVSLLLLWAFLVYMCPLYVWRLCLLQCIGVHRTDDDFRDVLHGSTKLFADVTITMECCDKLMHAVLCCAVLRCAVLRCAVLRCVVL